MLCLHRKADAVDNQDSDHGWTCDQETANSDYIEVKLWIQALCRIVWFCATTGVWGHVNRETATITELFIKENSLSLVK